MHLMYSTHTHTNKNTTNTHTYMQAHTHRNHPLTPESQHHAQNHRHTAKSWRSTTDPFDGVEHDEVEGVPTQVPVNDGERVAGGQTHQERPLRKLGGIVLNFMETAPIDRKGKLGLAHGW